MEKLGLALFDDTSLQLDFVGLFFDNLALMEQDLVLDRLAEYFDATTIRNLGPFIKFDDSAFV